MLNLFQHPCADICPSGVVFLASDRAWMLKQVQHDETWLEGIITERISRTDTIVADLVVGGQMLKDWGLHLIDMPVEMGDLVTLADRQAAAWRGVPWKSRKRSTRPAR